MDTSARTVPVTAVTRAPSTSGTRRYWAGSPSSPDDHARAVRPSDRHGAMGKVEASAERTIDAPAGQVYGYLADMHQHPRFLPPAFSDFQVEEGGVGAGSVTRFAVPAGGRTRSYRMRVTEPDPGRGAVRAGTNPTVVPDVNMGARRG